MPTARGVVRRPLRVGPWSGRVAPRTAALVAAASAAVVALGLWAVLLGDFPLSVVDVLAAAVGGGEGREAFIVRTLRLPRVLAAIGVGFALATSGAIFQGLVRNPLVAPDIIGVMAGATLAAVVSIVVLRSPAIVPVAALTGALAATVAVYGLTWRKGISGNRLVVVGIGVNALLIALTTLVIVRFPVEFVTTAIVWMTGTLYASAWRDVAWLAASLVVLLPAALALLPQLRIVQLGDDVAAALGAHTEASRAALLGTGATLAAAAVAVSGPVAFVALMTPHIARMLAGPLTGGVLLLAGLIGAALVVASDIVGQHAFSPISLPVGIVTAVVGAPYFMFLLVRANRTT
ncbi:MAG: iron chelate uptake ABC transporter family permease subunit [Actinobacteria bacterium]|nr:iron chelate uptake ABC transporter family permease subunit [Actinomycetota bacterium]